MVLRAELPDGAQDFEMKDDGASRDGAAGDGTWMHSSSDPAKGARNTSTPPSAVTPSVSP